MKTINLYGDVGFQINAADLLKEIGNEKDLIIRINSNGGDVFEAVTIYNRLKDLNCEVIIDGMCASAATIIACAGKKISMHATAEYMIHLPMIFLVGFYSTFALRNVQESLEKVNSILLGLYMNRVKIDEVELFEMLCRETHLSAEQALEYGFVDEIIEGENMDEKNLFEKFRAWMNSENDQERLKVLDSVKTESPAQQAIINLAKTSGKSLQEIQPELDAIAIAEKNSKNDLQEKLFDRLRDYFNSGAENIGTSPAKKTEDSISEVVKYAKEMKKP